MFSFLRQIKIFKEDVPLEPTPSSDPKPQLQLTPTQQEILSFLQNSASTVGVEAPTGTGKTVLYLKLAEMWNGKVIISSFTKNLQDQIVSEIEKFFPSLSYTVLKGKSNYTCQDKVSALPINEAQLLLETKPPIKLLEKVKVSSKYCRKDYHCAYKSSCEYMKNLDSVKNSKVVILNHYLLETVAPRFSEDNLLLIIDECHELGKALTKRVTFPKEIFQNGVIVEPVEPDVSQFKSKQEFNLAVEKYLTLKELADKARELNVDTPGEYELLSSESQLSQYATKTCYFSATFPTSVDVEDFYRAGDKRNWNNVTIIVKDTNYKQQDYNRVLLSTVKKYVNNYNKTLVLSTSWNTVEYVTSHVPEVKSNILAKNLKEAFESGQIKAAAGCDRFWTGINIPGKKAIIMTKLPFEHVDDSKDYVTAVLHMTQKLKQGIGRMLRSPECSGEIILLDNRIANYQEVLNLLSDYEQKGATVIYENDCHIKKQDFQNNKIVRIKHVAGGQK